MIRSVFVRPVAFLVFLAFLVPVVAAPTSAGAAPAREKFVRPIIRLAERPDINVVAPAHLPAPDTSTGIGPGSQLLIDRPDGSFLCTANFIWTGKKSKKASARKTTYLGAAGHCFLPEGKTSTHGPDADFDRRYAAVYACASNCEFGGELGAVFGEFVELGYVAYARQTMGDFAASNDFGIVEIPASIPPEMIRSSIPVWEGPSRVEDVTEGGPVCLYGNAAGFGEVFATKARAGIGEGLSENSRYWTAFIPSFQGDSGSSLVTCDEDEDGVHGSGAAGILTHIGLSQNSARILGTTTGRAVEMTKQDAGISLRLVLEDGTEVDPPRPPGEAPSLQPAVKPTERVHRIRAGGKYSWNAGPFTRADGVLGGPCSGRKPPSDHCDYEFLDLRVPTGGALMTVTVSTDNPDQDFDLYVYGPNGKLIDDSASEGTPPEEVSAFVTKPGVYTIGVDPWAVVEASYSGVAKLKRSAPPPADAFDGEVSASKDYAWEGDPPVDVNPLFTCAELVSDMCDNELINVKVPNGGATLAVDIEAVDDGDDFDVCLYAPWGTQTCFESSGDEHVELNAKLPGVYRVGVKAFTALGTYKGFAALR